MSSKGNLFQRQAKCLVESNGKHYDNDNEYADEVLLLNDTQTCLVSVDVVLLLHSK